MDNIVSFDEVAGFLCDPPTVAPHPDFAKLPALRQHIVKAMKQLECPQSFIHSWSGLTMAPNYALLEPAPLVVPIDPGAVPVYTAFAPPATIKMVDAAFEGDKNYYLSYKNFNRACFCMRDALVPNQFKVSNNPALMGWNASMSIQDILYQVETSYGKPSSGTLFTNNTLFKSPFTASEALKLLFYCIEQCQEIITLGQLPYTTEQIIQNALRLLMTSQIFPMKEFDTWENSMVKTYPALKTFIHEAYSCHLNSLDLRNMLASLGYTAPVHNMYHVLGEDNDDDSATEIMVTTIAAAATATGSTLGSGTAAGSIHPGLITAINQSIPPTFNQVVQNQSVLQNQIVAISMAQPPQRRLHPRSFWFHMFLKSHFSCINRLHPLFSLNNSSRQPDVACRASMDMAVEIKVVEAVVVTEVAAEVGDSGICPLHHIFAPRMVKGS